MRRGFVWKDHYKRWEGTLQSGRFKQKGAFLHRKKGGWMERCSPSVGGGRAVGQSIVYPQISFFSGRAFRQGYVPAGVKGGPSSEAEG